MGWCGRLQGRRGKIYAPGDWMHTYPPSHQSTLGKTYFFHVYISMSASLKTSYSIRPPSIANQLSLLYKVVSECLSPKITYSVPLISQQFSLCAGRNTIPFHRRVLYFRQRQLSCCHQIFYDATIQSLAAGDIYTLSESASFMLNVAIELQIAGQPARLVPLLLLTNVQQYVVT